MRRFRTRFAAAAAAAAVFCVSGHTRLLAAEQVTLRSGFSLLCDHRETAGERIRLYTGTDPANFVEVAAAEVISFAPAPEMPKGTTVAPSSPAPETSHPSASEPSASELRQMLTEAGAERNLDVDLLQSVIRAESGGHTHAVSRTGAQGLMQLMPGTARQLGVTDSFAPRENIAGGAAYLNALLLHFHDNLALALAAYNAGPAAVEHYRGIPPYRETRAYVQRVIHEFNRRKLLLRSVALATPSH